MTFSIRTIRLVAAASAVLVLGIAGNPAVWAAGKLPPIERQEWSFNGLTGHFDKEQLRRGYLVYKNVCASCHGMRQLYYRNLSEPGGPGFSEARVKEFAAEALVRDGPNDEGEMFERSGTPADKFVSPYPNDRAAAFANGGAVPPDLSNMTKARAIAGTHPWYAEPYHLMKDILTGYQEGGADYSYALLTGYKDTPPEGVELQPGLYYNEYFPGGQIAMPQPLYADSIEYPDGTATTVENYARDVTAFMMWASEPTLEERKQMGLTVLIYLSIFAVLLFLSKRALWRNVPH